MSPEIPQQWTDIQRQQQNQLQREQSEVLILSKIQRGSLSNESVVLYLQKFHNVDLSKYTSEIKKKFIEEIQIIFSELKDFDENMITKLRDVRESMSCWSETWKSNEYYRNMILWNKINTRIIILQESLKVINGEKIQIDGKEYNKTDYNSLKEQITQLDQENGIHIFSKLESKPIATNFRWLASLFYQELNKNIANPQPNGSLWYRDVLTWLSSIDASWRAEKLTNVKLINGKVLNLYELYKEYNKIYQVFVTQNQIFQIWNKKWRIDTKWFWFNDNYLFWYDKLEKIYTEKLWDIEKMNTADLIIMMRVLVWICPVFWDVVWWIDDLKQAKWWINFDGSIQWLWENMFWYFTWVLWVTLVWGTFAKIAKWPKLTKALMKLWQIIEKLSKWSWLIELGKNEKVIQMLEMMKWFVPKAWELLENIKNWAKKWTQKIADTLPNTTSVVTKPKKQVLPKTKIILWNIESLQKVEKYSIEICKSLWITKNSQKYKNIVSDVNLLLKQTSYDIENKISNYMEILKLNPNFSFWKLDKNFSPSIILHGYLKLLHNNELKDILIHQSNNSIIFNMIDNMRFNIPDNWEDFQLLLKIFEDFPEKNVLSSLQVLDIFSSKSTELSRDEKYKLCRL